MVFDELRNLQPKKKLRYPSTIKFTLSPEPNIGIENILDSV